MQKKMSQQYHCEGAAGGCGNLNPHDTKAVYLLRRLALQAEAISTVMLQIASRSLPLRHAQGRL
ncbi:MAG: hypothetical protein WAV28_08970 [Sedimentisphaerales bacterium]